MEDENALMNQSVVVVDDKVFKISEETPKLPEDATVIDGNGKYLVPGLAEMHAHIPTPDQGE
jgi:imidazolonepropionase-like amidohydrolase